MAQWYEKEGNNAGDNLSPVRSVLSHKPEVELKIMVTFNLNNQQVTIDVPDDMPVLWVLRDHLGLTGTKYGCGIAQCGACTIHIDGKAVRSCVVPAVSLMNKSVITIEGLSRDGELHPVQQAWIEEQVPQCGYCQPGMIMAAAAFLAENPQPDEKAIDKAITNICRCGTYPRIRKAIHRAAKLDTQPIMPTERT